MFQRILVPLDGSARAEQALPVAARIARHTGGSIVLFRAATMPIEFAWYTMESVRTMERVIDVDTAKAMDYLTTVAQSASLAGITTHVEVVTGEPAQSIFSIASSSQVDLIVMCSHGETGLKHWMLGSVAQKVARHSSIPVLIVHEGETHSLEGTHPVRLLVPLDGSPVAEAALAPAVQLCNALSAPTGGILHLVRVLPLPPIEQEIADLMMVASPTGPIPLGKDDSEDESERSEIVAATRTFAISEATTYLETVAQRLRTSTEAGSHLQVTTAVVLHPDIARTVLSVAQHGKEQEERAEGTPGEGSDVIAMATHGRGGLGRWLVGSVTERVLEGTRLPLLVIRPRKTAKQQELGGAGATTDSHEREAEVQSWVGLL